MIEFMEKVYLSKKNMNTIILIFLTLICLILIFIGIFLLRDLGTIGIHIYFPLIIIGIFGLFYLGATFLGNDIYTKETICSYTVGKSDEICSDIYIINYYYTFPTTSDKIGLGYFITDIILFIIVFREFLLMIWYASDCIKYDY